MNYKFAWLLCGLTFGVVGLLSLGGTTRSRAIDVVVTILRPDGSALAGAPVCLVGESASVGAVTANNGVATATIDVGSAENRIYVQVAIGCATEGSVQMMDVLAGFAVRDRYAVDIPVQGLTAAITITLQDAVTVTGRAVTAPAVPVSEGAVFVRGLRGFGRVQSTGVFSIKVPRNAPVELFLVPRWGQVKCLAVPAADADTTIGDVSVAKDEGSATLRIILQGVVPAHVNADPIGGSASLIAIDGSRVFTFAVRQGLVVGSVKTQALPKVPSGSYYVVPGSFGNSLSWRVLQAIRAGANLDCLTPIRVQATADQTTELQFALSQALGAIALVPE